MGDYLGDFFVRVIFQCIWTLTVVNTGNYIARYQNPIIRLVLRLQGLFRLPKCVQIFSEDDCKIPETDTKICAGLLTWCLVLSSIVAAGTLLGGRSWYGMTLRLILVLAAINGPICILLWIILAVSARSRERRRRAGLVAWPR